MTHRRRAIAVAAALLTAACTADPSAASSDSAPSPAADLVSTSNQIDGAPELTPQPCTAPPSTLDELPAPTEEGLIDASEVVFPCAESVVLLAADAPRLLGEASRVATWVGAPLLVFENDTLSQPLRAELARLAPGRIRVYGTLPTSEIGSLPIVTLLDEAGLPAGRRPNGIEQLEQTAAAGRPPTEADTVLLIGPEDRTNALFGLPMMLASGTTAALPVQPDDPTTLASLQDLAESGTELIRLSEFDATDEWRIDLAESGTELPGGGTRVFPGRRLVAFYGSPVTSRLGVLGEQSPEATLERLQPIVDSYVTPEVPLVQPAFEVIATVADSVPGVDGDYSRELALEPMREWIDVAAENEVFVLIDLQPGREDFLSQAKLYEEFLRMPHVGLALDPEWRLGPTELPLQRIGSVTASEVNDVVDWLVELVREETLPQKPLVLHQFVPRMLSDRETIVTPPELSVIVHVDGQGSLASKFATYSTITGIEQGQDQQLWWGWKNFYDEDRPLASPERVNTADPFPLVITYQ